jgi:hydrogenase 3 maturation protease
MSSATPLPPNQRVAILGIGHELRGDDAVGLAVASQLQDTACGRSDLLVIETGPVPENFTAHVRRFRPDLVVMVDAAIMGEQPGAVRWLDWQDLGGVSFSSHALSLNLLASYLNSELGCAVNIIGIQPANNSLNAPLSEIARQAVKEAVAMIEEILPVPAS